MNRKAKSETRPYGTNWDEPIEVNIQRNNSKAAIKRKVVSTGVVTEAQLEADLHLAKGSVKRMFEQVGEYLRMGRDVYLAKAVRFYNCMDKNLEKMFVSSSTLGGWFRDDTLDGIKVQFKHKGKNINLTGAKAQSAENIATFDSNHAENLFKKLVKATPGKVVVCPNCGTTIALSALKGLF